MLQRRRAVAILAALPAAVRAQGAVAAADARAVRAVIEAQLAAFAADDALAAFALAAPEIRDQFGNADAFIAMVRAGYPAVYRASRVRFLVPEPGDGGAVLQRVRMTDPAGRDWVASYVVQRQPDGRWRIGGCVLEASRDIST